MSATNITERQLRSDLLRGSNDVMRELIKSDTNGIMPFFCECNRDGCFAPAWLTVAEYDNARVEGAPIFATADAAVRAI